MVAIGLLLGIAASAPAVTVNGFSPLLGTPGTTVTITGSGFTSATQVLFDTINADFNVVSDGQITAIVPVGAATGFITVVVTQQLKGSSSVNFTNAPSIASFPPQGGAGTSLQIEGLNFIAGGTAIYFAGTPSQSVSVTSTAQLQATIPSGAGNGPITVRTIAGSYVSTNTFIVSSAPFVTDFSPGAGPAGTQVQIDGGNFASVTAVQFNGVGATVQITSSSQMQATVPAGANTGPIIVQNTSGTFVTTNVFVTGTQPVITDFSPTLGTPGATTVTIDGFNFNSTTAVKFGAVSAAITAASSTSLQVQVPSGAGNAPIFVTAHGQTSSTSSNFLATTGPVITNFSPVVGSPGAQVTLQGINLGNTGTVVKFGSGSVNLTPQSQNSATVQVPGTATTGPISITSGGITYTTPTNFTVTASGAPIITDFSPGTAPRGTTITIDGANFSGTGTTVSFNGLSGFNVQVAAGTTLTVQVPAGVTTGPLTVTTSGGSFTATNLFYAPPRLTGFTPPAAVVGAVLSINGTNFTGATSVTMNGADVPFVLASPNQIRVTIPTNATTGPIAVTAPAGPVTTTTNFVVLPNITSFSPFAGVVGTAVDIFGTSFFNVTNASAVTFGGVAAPFKVVSSTQISANVPPNSQTGPIKVTTPDGTATSATNFIVTYTGNVATLVTVMPDVLVLGSNLTYQITVTNIGPNLVTGLRVVDTLPGGSIFVSAVSSQGPVTQFNGTVTCDMGVLSNGYAATLTIVITPTVFGSAVNDVTATIAETETDNSNNRVVTSTPVLSDPQRTLTITLLQNPPAVRISWPQSAAAFTPQVDTNLVSNGNVWVNLPNIPMLFTNANSSVEYRITNSIAPPRDFFRLIVQ